MMKFRGWISLCLGSIFLTSCQNPKIENNEEILSRREQKFKDVGKLFGEEAFEFGGSSAASKSAQVSIGVNAYLWRAVLDKLSHMPLKFADPFGGVISTDWYRSPSTPEERLKVNVYILSRDLRADGLKVAVFRQKFEKGEWSDQPINTLTAEKLEQAILEKAREFYIQNNS